MEKVISLPSSNDQCMGGKMSLASIFKSRTTPVRVRGQRRGFPLEQRVNGKLLWPEWPADAMDCSRTKSLPKPLLLEWSTNATERSRTKSTPKTTLIKSAWPTWWMSLGQRVWQKQLRSEWLTNTVDRSRTKRLPKTAPVRVTDRCSKCVSDKESAEYRSGQSDSPTLIVLLQRV